MNFRFLGAQPGVDADGQLVEFRLRLWFGTDKRPQESRQKPQGHAHDTGIL